MERKARSEVLSEITDKPEYGRPASDAFEMLISPELYIRAPRRFHCQVDSFNKN